MKTVIIAGLARSGRNLISGMLKNMGVKVPVETPIPGIEQDPKETERRTRYFSLMSDLLHDRHVHDDIQDIRTLYADVDWLAINMMHVYNLSKLLAYFPESRMIVYSRSLIDMAKANRLAMKEAFSTEEPLIDICVRSAELQERLMRVVKSSRAPRIMTSFEAICWNTMYEVKGIAELLEIEMNDLMLARIVDFVNRTLSDLMARHGRLMHKSDV